MVEIPGMYREMYARRKYCRAYNFLMQITAGQRAGIIYLKQAMAGKAGLA